MQCQKETFENGVRDTVNVNLTNQTVYCDGLHTSRRFHVSAGYEADFYV